MIYRAVPSWFVRVENMVDKLLESNSNTYWYVYKYICNTWNSMHFVSHRLEMPLKVLVENISFVCCEFRCVAKAPDLAS